MIYFILGAIWGYVVKVYVNYINKDNPKIRLIKIYDSINDKTYYEIQEKSLLSGWSRMGKPCSGFKSQSDNLEEAEKHYNFVIMGATHKTEIILAN
jgi:hypothetical protein